MLPPLGPLQRPSPPSQTLPSKPTPVPPLSCCCHCSWLQCEFSACCHCPGPGGTTPPPAHPGIAASTPTTTLTAPFPHTLKPRRVFKDSVLWSLTACTPKPGQCCLWPALQPAWVACRGSGAQRAAGSARPAGTLLSGAPSSAHASRHFKKACMRVAHVVPCRCRQPATQKGGQAPRRAHHMMRGIARPGLRMGQWVCPRKSGASIQNAPRAAAPHPRSGGEPLRAPQNPWIKRTASCPCHAKTQGLTPPPLSLSPPPPLSSPSPSPSLSRRAAAGERGLDV
jgi:hypothetical protein